MFAADFLFNGQAASDFGLTICSFNGEFEAASGGEIEYAVVKTPDRNVDAFYGAQFNSVIQWNFSICKNPCKNSDLYFNQYEESSIAKWLLKTDGYKFLQFNQQGYEDIFYKVYFNMSPHQSNGRTIGYNLTATSDCAYGFTDVIKKSAVINFRAPLKFIIHSDIDAYIFPYVKMSGVGDFQLKNLNDASNKASEFYRASNEMIMDSDSDFITGLKTAGDFNWRFLRLVDNENTITTDSESDIKIEIQYREPRYIKV